MEMLDPDHVLQPVDNYRGVEIYLRWRNRAAPQRGREFYCTAARRTRMWELKADTIKELKASVDAVLEL
jgi:hypothetical protein